MPVQRRYADYESFSNANLTNFSKANSTAERLEANNSKRCFWVTTVKFDLMKLLVQVQYAPFTPNSWMRNNDDQDASYFSETTATPNYAQETRRQLRMLLEWRKGIPYTKSTQSGFNILRCAEFWKLIIPYFRNKRGYALNAESPLVVANSGRGLRVYELEHDLAE
jgi:hypothetical protein